MSTLECWTALRRLRATFPEFFFSPDAAWDGTWHIMANALKVFGFGHGARLRSSGEVEDYIARYQKRMAEGNTA